MSVGTLNRCPPSASVGDGIVKDLPGTAATVGSTHKSYATQPGAVPIGPPRMTWMSCAGSSGVGNINWSGLGNPTSFPTAKIRPTPGLDRKLDWSSIEYAYAAASRPKCTFGVPSGAP